MDVLKTVHALTVHPKDIYHEPWVGEMISFINKKSFKRLLFNARDIHVRQQYCCTDQVKERIRRHFSVTNSSRCFDFSYPNDRICQIAAFLILNITVALKNSTPSFCPMIALLRALAVITPLIHHLPHSVSSLFFPSCSCSINILPTEISGAIASVQTHSQWGKPRKDAGTSSLGWG